MLLNEHAREARDGAHHLGEVALEALELALGAVVTVEEILEIPGIRLWLQAQM